jgi:hypothetical protein
MEGNVIDLPSSILERLTNENKEFPCFFRLLTECGIQTNVGVREFTSNNDEFVISYTVAETLCLTENQIVDFDLLEKVLKGKFIKLEPLEKQFFEIPDYEDLLEEKLSKYPILSQNQIISLNIFNTVYTFKVLVVEHDWEGIDLETDNFELDCINVINTDIEVDIYNRFMEEEYYERIKKDALEKENEKKELEHMMLEDVNILKIGQRLGGGTRLTPDEMRRARLAKFKNK